MTNNPLHILQTFDRQVILTPDWLDHAVALSGFGFARLRLFRPSTVDLVFADVKNESGCKLRAYRSKTTPQRLQNLRWALPFTEDHQGALHECLP